MITKKEIVESKFENPETATNVKVSIDKQKMRIEVYVDDYFKGAFDYMEAKNLPALKTCFVEIADEMIDAMMEGSE